MNDIGSGTIIELFGAPGIGKSYIAKGLLACFRANGVSVSGRSVVVGQMSKFRRVMYKFRIIIPLLVLMPRILWIVCGFVLRAGVKEPVAFIRVLVNWLYIVSLVRREIMVHGIVILDQGVAQALWSTVFRGGTVDFNSTAELFANLLQACGAQQLVVVQLSVDLETHRSRLASRLHGCSPLDDGDPEKLACGLQTVNLVGEVIEQLANDGDNSILSKLDYVNVSSDNGYRLYEKLLDMFYVK